MFILLVRHARAEEMAASGRDSDRALTEDGIARFTAVAKTLSRLIEPPVAWLSSPYLRARQTAEILGKELGHDGRIEACEDLVPTADPQVVLTLLARKRSASVALVGHEPHLGNLLGWLLTGAAGTAIPMKKGMAAGVELEHPGSLPAQLVLALTQRVRRQ